MHNYIIPSRDALEFAAFVEPIEADALLSIESVSRLAGRSWLTARPSWKRSSASPIRKRSSFRPSAFARGSSTRGSPRRAGPRSAHRVGARVQSVALAGAGAWRRAVRLDKRLIELTHLEEDEQDGACAMPHVCCRTFPGAPIPTIAGSSPTTLWPTPLLSGSITRAGRSLLSRPATVICLTKRRFRRIAFPRYRAPTRSGANHRRGDAGRLQHLGGDARRPAARADGMPKGRVILEFAGRPRSTQRRAASVAGAAVCPTDRRRTGDPRVCLSFAER